MEDALDDVVIVDLDGFLLDFDLLAVALDLVFDNFFDAFLLLFLEILGALDALESSLVRLVASLPVPDVVELEVLLEGGGLHCKK